MPFPSNHDAKVRKITRFWHILAPKWMIWHQTYRRGAPPSAKRKTNEIRSFSLNFPLANRIMNVVRKPARPQSSELNIEWIISERINLYSRIHSRTPQRISVAGRPNYESSRFVVVWKCSFSFCLVLVILASHFRARMDPPKKSPTWSPA